MCRLRLFRMGKYSIVNFRLLINGDNIFFFFLLLVVVVILEAVWNCEKKLFPSAPEII